MVLKLEQMRHLNFLKLGVEYYTFHDRDVAPEGKNLNETNEYLWDMAK